MSAIEWIAIGITLLLALAIARPIGKYMAGVFDNSGAPRPLDLVFGPIDRFCLSVSALRINRKAGRHTPLRQLPRTC